MFASLKNKIKEETGEEVSALPSKITNNRVQFRGRLSSSASAVSCDEIQILEQKDAEISSLRAQCKDLVAKVVDLNTKLEVIHEERTRIDKTNEILLESVRVAQNQKELYCDEQEKIQNMQLVEIDKLKSLLSFREQEAVDRLSTLKQNQQQIENLTAELERLKPLEPIVEDTQDELQRLRHSSQLDKNNLTTTLAAVEEENRHLKTRLQIVDKLRIDMIVSLGKDEKMQTLVQERKLLEQHLEEAHLQLSDIKSSWSGQNLALETQLSRLSRQVAEETTEKRKALKLRDEHVEKVKGLEFELEKCTDSIQQRDLKIKILSEEVDELNLSLKECREINDEEIICLKNQLESSLQEIKVLKSRIVAADERFNEYAENSEQVTKTLRSQNSILKDQLDEVTNNFENEKEDKLTALLRNAEISQSEEILRKELRIEREESNDLHDQIIEMKSQLKAKKIEISEWKFKQEELKSTIYSQKDNSEKIERLNNELNEKNKTIKTLNQRLGDLKKTLQRELQSNPQNNSKNLDKTADGKNGNINSSIPSTQGPTSKSGTITMDEVNFKYLKHVIVKFLTSREVEARQLIKAVSTLLHLSPEEEKLLYDTLNWKMSWFGSKPDHRSGQQVFSLPPS